MNKKFIAKISAVFLALIVGFGAPATALAADTGGGIGGGGSTGTLTGPIYWKSVAYNDSNATNQKTWKKFLSETANSNAEVESQVRGRVGNLEVCKKSKVIWYVNHRATNNWVFNYSYTATHGSEWNKYWNNYGDSTIENPYSKIGRVPTTSEINAFKKWDSVKNGSKINKKPGYTVICSGAFLPPPDEYFERLETKKRDTSNNSGLYRHPYSYTTDIKPQFVKAAKEDKAATKDLIGDANLKPQIGTPVKTNFGNLWDRIDKGLKLSPAELDKQVKAAVAKDKSISHSVATLNADNKAGMAEGGVLNVYEQTRYAEVSASSLTKIDDVQKCRYVKKWNDNTQQFNAPKLVSCTPYSSTPTETIVTMKSEIGTLENTGFYQMLSVHCNPDQFKALTDSGNGITVTSGSEKLTRGKISASAVTKRYDKQPAKLDFGDASNPNAARAATGLLGFYDKECGFECTANSSSSNAQANGATDNVETGGNIVDGNRGGVSTTSKSGTVNSNSLEFFRDNDKNQVNVDLWYPARDSEVVLYGGEEAITTTVSRWEEGTPNPKSNSGGKFTMTSAKDNKTLFTGDDAVKVQKNWNEEEFNNVNSTILPGQHTSFALSSTWASEQGKPQVLNVKYEYAPTVNSRIYTNNIGFGAGKSQNLGTATNVSTEIQGKCYVNYRHDSSESQMDTSKLFSENTGTGSTNNLDGKIVQGAGSVSEAKDKQTNLVVNFVRSTTE